MLVTVASRLRLCATYVGQEVGLTAGLPLGSTSSVSGNVAKNSSVASRAPSQSR